MLIDGKQMHIQIEKATLDAMSFCRAIRDDREDCPLFDEPKQIAQNREYTCGQVA